jgi:energy-converting hydrogenase Eha subunit F
MKVSFIIGTLIGSIFSIIYGLDAKFALLNSSVMIFSYIFSYWIHKNQKHIIIKKED